MENQNHDHVIGIPVSTVTYAAKDLPGEPASFAEPASSSLQSNTCESSNVKEGQKEAVVDRGSKLGKNADNYMRGIREHVTFGPKISETLKGKLSLGARILQAGGVERVFKQAFSVRKGEKLLKAFQCHLSTTAGPIAGMLFISSEKIAFHSDKSIALTSPTGGLARVPYKVLIPLKRIKEAIPSENVDKPNQKYVQIITEDDFEFWFMGFVSYQRSFKYLQQAISELCTCSEEADSE